MQQAYRDRGVQALIVDVMETPDPEGIIRFFTLLDSANFDARLVALRARLDELLVAKP